MLELSGQGAKVMQIRAVEFANKYKVLVRVLSSFEPGSGTLILQEEDGMEDAVITGIASQKDQTKFIQKLMDNKLLTVRAAENVVRLLPPLNVTKQEINLGLKILDKVCKNYR